MVLTAFLLHILAFKDCNRRDAKDSVLNYKPYTVWG